MRTQSAETDAETVPAPQPHAVGEPNTCEPNPRPRRIMRVPPVVGTPADAASGRMRATLAGAYDRVHCRAAVDWSPAVTTTPKLTPSPVGTGNVRPAEASTNAPGVAERFCAGTVQKLTVE